ncbi:MAG: hypothetical protein SCK29_12570 [Bacillota bacterium]|nr:hypothetical protein [Bacillota bacterium]MDW7684935.1 hypothetical protein [Bacillota bacterium]
MTEKETRILRRGIPREEYLEYFKSAGGDETEPGHFVGPGWEVIVGEEKGVKILGQIMRESEILFRGEEEVIGKLLSQFRIKFMRA